MQPRLCQGLVRAGRIRGREVAVVDGEVTLDWARVALRVARLAGVFRAAGLEPGGRVALLAMNSHRSLECFLAAPWAGGIIAPVNHRLAPGEMAGMIADLEPTLLVIGPEFLHLLPALRGAATGLRGLILAAPGAAPEGLLPYEAALETASPAPEAGRAGDDVACIFYTGGTTGSPKGVMLSHANIMANTVHFVTGLGVDESLVHLHCGPLFHVAAAVRLYSVTQVAGRHVILPRFQAAEALAAIGRHGVTLATFVPTMLQSILREPVAAEAVRSLRWITYGAAPMPEALLREAMERFPHVRFVQSYGMTETSPIATMLGHSDHLPEAASKGRLRSAGRPALMAELRIVGPDGAELPPGGIGEITVRGPMVMRGYWRRPEETKAAIRDGWMHTGDIGYCDADGYLYVVDRLKDVIISGGENVFSQEVEHALASHPAVMECAVVGRPDPVWGEAVHAFVVPRPGMVADPESLLAHCRERIAGYKCPRSFTIRDAPLPMSGANKIAKNELRREISEQAGGAG